MNTNRLIRLISERTETEIVEDDNGKSWDWKFRDIESEACFATFEEALVDLINYLVSDADGQASIAFKLASSNSDDDDDYDYVGHSPDDFHGNS